jgi:hypothetical protein
MMTYEELIQLGKKYGCKRIKADNFEVEFELNFAALTPQTEFPDKPKDPDEEDLLFASTGFVKKEEKEPGSG